MSYFSNLKIGARLTLGFSAILALTFAIGAGAINRLGAVNDATADIATNWLPATRDLGTYRSALNAERRAEAMLTVATTPEVVAAETSSLNTARDSAVQAWKSYETTISGAEERALAEAIDAAAKTWRETEARSIGLAAKGDNAGAAALYRGDGMHAFKALVEAVDKCVDFQSKGADTAFQASQDSYHQTRALAIALLVAAIGIGFGLAWAITRSITGPIRDAVKVAETVAGGDLSSRIAVTRTDEAGQLLGALMRMNDSLAAIVGDVRRATDSIATGSAQIATGNADLSQRTEEQASNLQQTAASMEQLTVTVKNNADAAHQARQLSETAHGAATQGGQVVGRVVATMEQITESSRRISDIIGVIDGIAFQTNILALNAAVEAARAGEQGRGFAVVAGEVRALAQRSAEAAKEIKQLIGASVERVEEGRSLVDDAGRAIDDIVTQVRRVNDLVAEISAASVEQSSGIGQIGDAVAQLDQVTQQNAALVEESAAAAESLRHQADLMSRAVAVFRLGADTDTPFAAPKAATSAGAKPEPRSAAGVAARAKALPAAVSAAKDEAWAEF
jgi:methyl-accepting chemotaxis protein